MDNSFYCCLPESIYSIIEKQPCTASIKKESLDIINTKTNEIIASLSFKTIDKRTEVVNVKETSIELSMPVNNVMEIVKNNCITRSKTNKFKPNEKTQLDIPPLFESSIPIATMKNLSDEIIVREHIRATLEYIGENFSSNDDKINALSELIQFILNSKIIKQKTNLQNLIEALKEAKRKRDIPEMKRTLSIISNKI